MDTKQKAHIIVPPDEIFIEPVLHFIQSFVKGLGAGTIRCEELCKVVESAISLLIKNSREVIWEHPMEIVIYEINGRLVVEITNHGVPLIPGNTASLGPLHVEKSHRFFEKISVENRGRCGQVVTLRMKLGKPHVSNAQCEISSDIAFIEDGDVIIRGLREGEEGALSQLFYHVYEYNYINEIVYYPEKIREMVRDGRLISVVASTPSGRLLGHLGLMKWNDDPPVYEPCLGLTAPAVKGRGIFKKVLARIMAITDELPMHYCFFDFVTNHDYTQKLVSQYSPCELAIFIGSQSSQTQAKLEKLGIGEDPKYTNRFSILYSIIPKIENPFGTKIILPNKLGEMLGFLLKPLNLTWSPASRFSTLDVGGKYRMHCEPAQSSVVFDCEEPGLEAVENIIKDWRELLREGYQYAALEVPVNRSGLGALYDLLAAQGFFIAGFVTYHHSSELGFRFQALAPIKVDFSEIKTYSDDAKALLKVIKEDYERNCAV